jgi:hypothetical protein
MNGGLAGPELCKNCIKVEFFNAKFPICGRHRDNAAQHFRALSTQKADRNHVVIYNFLLDCFAAITTTANGAHNCSFISLLLYTERKTFWPFLGSQVLVNFCFTSVTKLYMNVNGVTKVTTTSPKFIKVV